MDRYVVESMTEKAAKQICGWQYEPPYTVYNYLNYKDAVKTQAAIAKAENAENYICFWDDNTLVAYTSVMLKGDKVFIGIGISPRFCSQGSGAWFLNETILKAQKRYAEKELWVQVRSWNKRAIKCYESCSFKEIYRETAKDKFGNDEEFVFMCMEKQ